MMAGTRRAETVVRAVMQVTAATVETVETRVMVAMGDLVVRAVMMARVAWAARAAPARAETAVIARHQAATATAVRGALAVPRATAEMVVSAVTQEMVVPAETQEMVVSAVTQVTAELAGPVAPAELVALR